MKVFTKQFNVATALLLLLCLTGFIPAKAGAIKGTVTDQDTKETLIGAVIQITGNNFKQSTAADLEGDYSFKQLKPGTYTITCTYTGYQKQTEVIAINDVDTRHNIAMVKGHSELKEVIVKSKLSKGSDASARLSEKNADQLLNVISAKSIKLLPDVTVANVLQRVSGVSIERSNNGDGQYAIIRGMDKRYNYTLINGIKIPSPDSKNRYVPLDIFPSDLLERLEVIKALTPNMEGDAIGGAMNMVMKNAPDELLIDVSVATGYNDLFGKQDFLKYNRTNVQSKSPQERFGSNYLATGKDFPSSNLAGQKVAVPLNQLFNLTIGNRFGEDKKLGAILGLTYQDTYRGANSIIFQPGGQPNQDPAPGNNASFSDLLLRQYSSRQQRTGGYLRLDYSFNDRNKISLTNMLMKLNEFQYRSTVDSVLNINSTGPGNRLVQNQVRTRSQYQTIYNTTLLGEHQLTDRLKANWTLTYSQANNSLPDWAEYLTAFQVTTNSQGNVSRTANNEISMTRRWQHNSDRDLSGYANVSYHVQGVDITAGGMYRAKKRDNYYIQYDLKPPGPLPFTNIDNAQFGFPNASEGQGLYPNTNTYTANENVGGGYLMAKAMLSDKLQLVGGVRAEHTYFDYQTILPASYTAASGNLNYTDFLPSLHFKYDLDGKKKQDVRLSYFRSISRPGFNELTPYSILGEYYDERGNPFLKHTTADNIDLRYEWFPKGLDQVLVGVFYKNIVNPIENALVPSGILSYVQPNNFGTATNYGAEIVLTKYIKSFGINFNYTYTHSAITTSKEFYGRSSYPSGPITPTFINQTRPLQNQSAHIANLSFLYKGKKSGLDAQIALVYTGPRIVFVSPFYQLDFWQKGTVQTDLSLEKKLNKHFSIYSKVNNLLNAAYTVELRRPYVPGNTVIEYQPGTAATLVQKELYGRNYLLGLRYHFD
jgi:hypothetical protein